jgi:hypothetical protein
MKTMMMMLVLVSAAPVLAMELSEGGSSAPVVSYVSWCDGNSVIGQDAKGDLYVRANCDDAGLKCKATQTYRETGSQVTAACVK